MKHDILHSVAHNFVDSFGNGNGFLIGVYMMDVYGEAANSKDGFIEIDFLSGRVAGGPISDSLAAATLMYREELPSFCKKHGASLTDFETFIAKFWNDGSDRHCEISVQGNSGKLSKVEYAGVFLKKTKS